MNKRLTVWCGNMFKQKSPMIELCTEVDLYYGFNNIVYIFGFMRKGILRFKIKLIFYL